MDDLSSIQHSTQRSIGRENIENRRKQENTRFHSEDGHTTLQPVNNFTRVVMGFWTHQKRHTILEHQMYINNVNCLLDFRLHNQFKTKLRKFN